MKNASFLRDRFPGGGEKRARRRGRRRVACAAFAGGELHSYLQRKHIDTLIVSGGETDVCVLATVLTAIDLGYRLIIVEDALCSSSDESHDGLLALYAKRFDFQIEVSRSEQIKDLWRPAE